jgi:hypothetical protein
VQRLDPECGVCDDEVDDDLLASALDLVEWIFTQIGVAVPGAESPQSLAPGWLQPVCSDATFLWLPVLLFAGFVSFLCCRLVRWQQKRGHESVKPWEGINAVRAAVPFNLCGSLLDAASLD